MKEIKILLIAMFVALFSSSALAAKVLEVEMIVGRDDKVIGKAEIIYGPPSAYRNETGLYRMVVADSIGNAVWSRNYDLRFYMLTDPPKVVETEIINERIKFNPYMYELKLYKGDRLLFNKVLDSCDNNGVCDENENAISCSDCPNWTLDGICIGIADEHCDFDCIEGFDPDCIARENKMRIANKLVILAIILFAITMLIAFCERKRIGQMLKKVLRNASDFAIRIKMDKLLAFARIKLKKLLHGLKRLFNAIISYFR